jgi:opacity protein-like surface antigen
MQKYQGWVQGAFFISILLVGQAYADFQIMPGDRPLDPCYNNDYGNGQTGSFYRAIQGGTPLTSAQEAELSNLMESPSDYPFYGRVRLNFSTLALDEIKNRSTGTDALGQVAKKRTTANQAGLEIAIGYAWSDTMRGDIEYLANKNLSYTANPVLTGTTPTRRLDTQLKNSTLLANVYYDFSGLNRLKPYVTGGLGLAINNAQVTLTPPTTGATAANNPRNLSVAWTLGAGFRVAVFTRWHIDAAYRYIRLGNGLNIKANSNFKLIGTYSMTALSLGLMYSF